MCPSGVLANEYDAVYVATDGAAHMPTRAQFEELTANTTSTWETLNGINGYRFTSNIDATKSIFFPCGGYAAYGTISNINVGGDIWTSSLHTSMLSASYRFGFDVSSYNTGTFYRNVGCNIRGVVV